MKKNSKKPEVRRKELIDIASALFAEKGYEDVSIRDILEVVDGAPGMFYYYFKSKQDVYIAAMEQYINERLERKCKVIEDTEMSFEEKLEIFRSFVTEDISDYAGKFHVNEKMSISDSSYRLWDFVQMLNHMIEPYAHLILQGIKEGKLKSEIGIDENNANLFATFLLYGAWGIIYNSKFTKNNSHYTVNDVLKITDNILH
ncbi:TetR/AcrR family transcriptional regulator [Mediterraneibacter glycyrrhizinilyticus]|uniref:TetR/AcrR family transcriptional regulator n=1 Tax=Mediterraneibacter glycyrrhizinilyticus TaxID=342942 RepID=UPI001961E081|nr:TetR/AcrR family transcriptional regulator [Mediterraneibacter glycyrrhizinilyticus]MBM6750041.1 TetR/AcrR family transcriptional regulator [Mediterraneibacter glycyrrhizinilyticus]